MRNRFVCLLLALVMALPLLLASCSRDTEIEDKAAPVYTLYCITGDTTTAKAITEIEYDLNNTLFYRIGTIVKLVMVTADEYHDLIETTREQVKGYLDGTYVPEPSDDDMYVSMEASSDTSSGKTTSDSGNKKPTLVNTAKMSRHALESGYTAMSGEAILNDLQEGIDIELECPRLDLFLITDYESYLKMAENGDLVALDTVLSNEAKAIKSYVHSSFFNAAKVKNKTYGIPCNTTIGKYTYLVFDKEVLEESGVAQETLRSLDDLSDYLALIKETRPDVVPLGNHVTPSSFSFMFENGFVTYVNESGYVRSTYEGDPAILSYFAMLSKYRTLGYYENIDGMTGDDDGVKFGAKFVTGTKEEIETLAEENGYLYNLYSVPIATSENSIGCIYGLSVLCPQSWQTAAMRVLTQLYVDEDLQNTFLYGIENVHYRLDNNQVVRLNRDYMMDFSHTGNCFIAYTDKDANDSPTKWEDARNQNIDAKESKTIGFTYVPEEFKFGDEKAEDEDLKWSVQEPDYEAILWGIVETYYNNLENGTAIVFDYQHEQEVAKELAEQSIYDDLLATYTLRLTTKYTASLKDEIAAQYGEQYRTDALSAMKDELADSFGSNSRKRKLKEKLKEENPDLDDDAIDALMTQVLADKETLWENYRTIVRKENQWQEAIESAYQSKLRERLDQETDRVLSSAAYQKDLAAIPGSEKFQKEYQDTVELEVEDTVRKNIDEALTKLIQDYCDEMIAECEAALTEAINAFTEEYSAATRRAFETGVMDQMKVLFKDRSEDEQAKLQQEWITFVTDNATIKDDKLAANMDRMLKTQFTELTDEERADKALDMLDMYRKTLLPLYQDAYNKDKLALYKIGFATRSALTEFTTTSEDSEDETSEASGDTDPGTPDGEAPTPGAYETYYEFVITAKFRTPYYEQFGSPS